MDGGAGTSAQQRSATAGRGGTGDDAMKAMLVRASLHVGRSVKLDAGAGRRKPAADGRAVPAGAGAQGRRCVAALIDAIKILCSCSPGHPRRGDVSKHLPR